MALSRAQKVTLAVGVPLTLAAIGFGGLNAVAAVGRGTEQFSMGVPVTAGKLTMHVSSGDIRMVPDGLPAGSASLTASVHYSLVRPHVSISGDSISVNCADPFEWCGASATLSVPRDVTAAVLSTDKGDLTVSGPAGPATLSLSSSMGDITASGVTASDVSAHSDMGDITLTFTRPPTKLTVTDSMGDIDIVLPFGSSYRVDARSDLGDVRAIHSDPNAPNVIVAHSSMGDVTVTQQ